MMKNNQNSIQDIISQSTANTPRIVNFNENIRNSVQQENSSLNLLEISSSSSEHVSNEYTNALTLIIDNNDAHTEIYEHRRINNQLTISFSENFSILSNSNFNNNQGTDASEQIVLFSNRNFPTLSDDEDNNDKVLFDYSITDFNYLKLYYGADNEHLTLC